jgi:hypothetical protein
VRIELVEGFAEDGGPGLGGGIRQQILQEVEVIEDFPIAVLQFEYYVLS